MRQRDEAIEVGGSPELLGLAEEVRETGRPRLLRHDGEPLAMIVPLTGRSTRQLKPRQLSAEDIMAFRAAAGTWGDVDVDALLTNLYAARDVRDDRPPVEF